MSLQFNDQAITEKFIKLCEDVSSIKTDIVDIKQLKDTVDKHEKIVTIGKFLGVPALAAFHVSLKHFLTKIGL